MPATENLLAQALEQSPILIFTLDQKGVLTSMGGGQVRSLGINADDLLGKPVFRLKQLPVRRSHLKRLRVGKKFCLTMQIGGRIFDAWLIPAITDGVYQGATGCCLDVTERISIEEHLDYERFQAVTAQRLNSLAGMANGMAHEINNPLAIISGFSQQIHQIIETEPINTGRIRHLSERMVYTCNRIARIIRSLQDFSPTSAKLFSKPSSSAAAASTPAASSSSSTRCPGTAWFFAGRCRFLRPCSIS